MPARVRACLNVGVQAEARARSLQVYAVRLKRIPNCKWSGHNAGVNEAEPSIGARL